MSLNKFKFSLEVPLKIKKVHKKQAEADLLDAKYRMDIQKKRLDLLNVEGDRLQLHLTSLLSKGIKAKELSNISGYLKVLVERIAKSQEQYLEISRLYKDLLDAMIKLMNEIDTLENLKEKQKKEYILEIHKKEEKVLEEIINYKSFVQGGVING